MERTQTKAKSYSSSRAYERDALDAVWLAMQFIFLDPRAYEERGLHLVDGPITDNSGKKVYCHYNGSSVKLVLSGTNIASRLEVTAFNPDASKRKQALSKINKLLQDN